MKMYLFLTYVATFLLGGFVWETWLEKPDRDPLDIQVIEENAVRYNQLRAEYDTLKEEVRLKNIMLQTYSCETPEPCDCTEDYERGFEDGKKLKLSRKSVEELKKLGNNLK